MMTGGGHMQDMLNRVKQNRGLGSSKKRKFKGNNRELLTLKEEQIYSSYRDKKVSPEKLKAIKQKIRERANKENRIELSLYIIVFILICIGIFYLVKN
ncbi:hypothetical protein [Aureivirga sp. CE67]|uniref:hypothetical protein n=1 Tax=Aureivirga sp. CE67 TaxID=1788983 RepID=UPI0018C93BED|nr:hypothetical protein [Aureivirga sp. CE67]